MVALRDRHPQGADIVVAEGRASATALASAAPYVGFRDAGSRNTSARCRAGSAARWVDGKASGFSPDARTREQQYPPREKAISNICTNVPDSCATAFRCDSPSSARWQAGSSCISAALNHEAAIEVVEALAQVPGVEVLNDTFFNEFTAAGDAALLVEKARHEGILAGVPVSRLLPGAIRDRCSSPSPNVRTADDRAALVAADLLEALWRGDRTDFNDKGQPNSPLKPTDEADMTA